MEELRIYLPLLFLTIRVLFLQNPLSWSFYRRLTVDDVGWRQKDEIHSKFEHYLSQKPVEYLAVGSSQTGAVYEPYAKQHDHLRVLSFAGMGTLDLLFYQPYIFHEKPQNILLYLSEFDLARRPSFDAIKLGPPQGFSLAKILPKVNAIYNEDLQLWNREMIAGEIFPEYKYAFVFQGFLDKITQKNRALSLRKLSKTPNNELLKQQLKNVKKNLDDNYLERNILSLREFITILTNKSINLYIIEGQYHPKGYNRENAAMNKKVKQQLFKLDKEYDFVQFIPRSETLIFQEKDYLDGTHVKWNSGYKFANQLINNISQ